MTTSSFGRIDRRNLIASSVVGAAAFIATGQPSLAKMKPNQRAMLLLAQDSSSDVPMFRGNAARTGEMPGPGLDASNGVEVLWTFKADERVSSPVIVGETVYVGNWNGDSTAGLDLRGGHLFAINSKDGMERWRFGPGSGAFSTPTVVDGVVYVGCFSGDLYAVNAADGSERWHFNAGDWAGSSPVVSDGTVYVGGGDNLYAVNMKDGTERWRFPTGEGEDGCPAVIDGVVYVGQREGTLFAINVKDGTERWRFDTDGSIRASVAVADSIVHVGSFDNGILYAIRAEDGTEYWRLEGAGGGTSSSGMSTSPAVSAGVVYSVIDRTLYAVSAKDGTERWRFDAEALIATPVVAGDIVYFVDSEGVQFALNREDGSTRWQIELDSTNELLTSPVLKDGVLYVSSGNSVYALGARVPKLNAGGTARVTEKTILRGGPAPTAVEREGLNKDATVTITGEAVTTNDIVWWPVTVDGTGDQGWIEASKLEPLTSGPELTTTS